MGGLSVSGVFICSTCIYIIAEHAEVLSYPYFSYPYSAHPIEGMIHMGIRTALPNRLR